MIFRDYYRILELDTNKVSQNQIKVAYRELAKKYHPDVNIGNKKAEERFKDINEAYRVLTDTKGKKRYDRMWVARIGSRKKMVATSQKEAKEQKEQDDTIFSEFFNMFFGTSKDGNADIQSKKPAKKGENIDTEINISLEEGFYGLNKKIVLKAVDGNSKAFSIKIPAGIRNGEKIRLIGQGKEGLNGGKNGDLFIKINIIDNLKLKLEGYDLKQDLLLTPWEAALGDRITVQGIDEEITIYVPAGIREWRENKNCR